MFVAIGLLLIGLTGLGVCGLLLLMRISEALADLDAETWR